MFASTVIGSDRLTSDPVDMLIHYALGDSACYTGTEGTPAAWLREAHRGVHLLNDITFPKTQKRYILSSEFDFRIDSAFDEVLRSCADLSRTGYTWIVPELQEAYLKLYEMGFAHSYETWHDGKLAGGCFGVQVGAYATVESMFYRISNASKSAYGRALLLFKERGFTLIDSNPVKDSSRNYGEQWIPFWKYERLLRDAMAKKATLSDSIGCPELPWSVRQLIPVARFIRKLGEKIRPRAAVVAGR